MSSENQRLAEEMHRLGHIYWLYGLLDGLNLSYSMIKYLFDLFLATSELNAAEEMHEWMMSPGGIAAAASTTITLVVFAMLANHFDDQDKNVFKRYIAILWPYWRDVMKGLRNAYKGFKSAINVAEALGGFDLRSLMVPVGLLLGGLSLLNRLWFRWMRNKRKDMIKAHAEQIKNIQDSKDITLDELYKTKIERQSIAIRGAAYLSAAYGGVIDGAYLFVGVLGLSALAPPALIAMTVFCAIYFIACIATRVYEEYDYQRKQRISELQVEYACEGKKLELLIARLQHSGNKDLTEDLKLCGEVLKRYEEVKQELRSLSSMSYASAFLSGLKDGLAAYGVVSCMLFAIAIFTSCPPAFLVAGISFGMILLIGFITYSLVYNYQHPPKEDLELVEAIDQSVEGAFVESIRLELQELKPVEVKAAILDGMVIDSSPEFAVQKPSEVIRSFFSGMRKGVKNLTFVINELEVDNISDHYHESPVMFSFMVLSSLVHGLVLSLRAHARLFGRDAKPLDSDTEIEGGTVTFSKKNCPPPLTQQDAVGNVNPESVKRVKSFLSNFSFYAKNFVNKGSTSYFPIMPGPVETQLTVIY